MKSAHSKTLRYRLLFTAVFFTFCLPVFGQIDSVDVNIHFETGTSPWDSSTVDILHVDVSVYDVDFLGVVVATLYEAGTDYPISMVKMSLAEFITANQKSGETVTVLFYEIAPEGSYRIETQVRNFQDANLPLVVTNHNL